MKKSWFWLITAIMLIGFMTTAILAVDNVDNDGEPSSEVQDYINSIKSELLLGNDVILDRNIVLDGSYITSIAAATNGDGQYLNPGIFNVVGGYGDGEVTFDLNGYTITYIGHADFEYTASKYKPASGYANSCSYAHGLFLANNGAKITITDSVGTGEINVYGMASGAYSCSPDSVITVKGGTWNNYPCETCKGTNLFMYASHGGELYIEDGRFVQEISSENESYLLVKHGGVYKNSVIDFSKTKVEVSGGTFIGMNPANAKFCYEDEKGNETWDYTNIVAEGCKAVEIGDGEWFVFPEADEFTIVFRYWLNNTTQGTYNQAAYYDEGLTLRENSFNRAGYTFSHWNSKRDTNDGKFTFVDGETLTAEQVNELYEYAMNNNGKAYLNAYWTPNNDTQYKVKHLLLAANGVDVYKAHATYTKYGTTDTLTSAVAVNIEGYSPIDFDQLNINGNGSTVVEIYYERNNYTLSYNLDGGDFTDDTVNPQTVQYYKLLNYPADPIKTGYTFNGWDMLYERMPAGDLTVAALWNANKYTVRFDANGGEGIMEDMSMVYDQEQTLPVNAFTNKGYTFSGWKLGDAEYADGADVSNLTAEDNAIVTLSAIWTPNTYTVCFNGNGGSGNMDDISRTFKDKQPLPECDFVREGYTFIGWNTKSDAETAQYVPGDKYNLVSTNGKVVTLYAIWRANGYVVTFDVNGGDKLTPDSMPVVYNSVYGTLPTPTRSGYIFKAWTINNTVINADTIVSIVGDHTLVAEWTDNEFTVTFETNGGSSIDMQSIPGGGTVIEPTDPKKKNYVFAGWYADEECTVIFDFSTPIYSDTILYANWEEATDSDLNIWYMLLLKIRNQIFEVTADATDGGTITPEGITEVKYDNDITYTITPDEGYVIADVIVDGESVGAVSEYTFKGVREAHTITVVFGKSQIE